jgi:copper chaperone NosL
MTIADPRFTAEAISSTGKRFDFDDIGCLTSWLRESGTPIRDAWVASFVTPADWIPADSAIYLTTASLRTPMSSGLIGLRPGAEADSVLAALGGTLRTWSEVRTLAHEHAVAP